MGQLVTSLNTNRNQTTYLADAIFGSGDGRARSPTTRSRRIDAAFIALALHNYKSQPATPAALRDAIDALENRFDFPRFRRPARSNRHIFQPTGQFGCCTYSGYTNENKVIALAAELSDDHHVPLASQWNKDTGRVLASLVDPKQNHLVYSFGTEYRAPFVQALLNLFVDTSERGADNYPDAQPGPQSMEELRALRSGGGREARAARPRQFLPTRCRRRRRHVPAVESLQQLRPAESVPAVERCAER